MSSGDGKHQLLFGYGGGLQELVTHWQDHESKIELASLQATDQVSLLAGLVIVECVKERDRPSLDAPTSSE
jgi:hypothetical protein